VDAEQLFRITIYSFHANNLTLAVPRAKYFVVWVSIPAGWLGIFVSHGLTAAAER
jgi:hypothetical protein